MGNNAGRISTYDIVNAAGLGKVLEPIRRLEHVASPARACAQGGVEGGVGRQPGLNESLDSGVAATGRHPVGCGHSGVWWEVQEVASSGCRAPSLKTARIIGGARAGSTKLGRMDHWATEDPIPDRTLCARFERFAPEHVLASARVRSLPSGTLAKPGADSGRVHESRRPFDGVIKCTRACQFA